MQQIEFEVAAVEDVLAGPGVAHGVDRQRALPAGDEVIAVAGVDRVRQRGVGRVGIPLGAAGEEEVDGVGDQLDVAVLLGGDVGDQVVERPRLVAAAEVERLHGVVHEGGQLAEATTQQLLDRRRRVRRGVLRLGELDRQAIDTQDHRGLSLCRSGVQGGRL